MLGDTGCKVAAPRTLLGSTTKSYYGEGLAINNQTGGDASVDLLTMLV